MKNAGMVWPALGGMSSTTCPACGATCWKYALKCFVTSCGAPLPKDCWYCAVPTPGKTYLVYPIEGGKVTNPLLENLCEAHAAAKEAEYAAWSAAHTKAVA